ncbi:MAG TPA: FtsQ-type POTRA domain-containing protein [Gammaproteobacteria bacterium]
MKWFRRKKKPNRRVTSEAKPQIRWQKAFGFAVAGAGVLGIAAGISVYLEEIEWERFKTLEITGELDRVGAAEVRDVLQPYIASGFAGIDMRAAQESLEALPWVAKAKVRRQWPGALLVEVREESPVATWFGTALMNEDGIVFVDGAAGFASLPDVGGPAGTQDAMLERLRDLREATRTNGLELRRLLRTERRAERFWFAGADGKTVEVRLGRRDVDERLQRFLKAAWPALENRVQQIEYVDMRYTNGFAVGWKSAGKAGVAGQEKG